jgi:two-component system, OmpR family, phosphate regulon sensor histidine kinase PhoR
METVSGGHAAPSVQDAHIVVYSTESSITREISLTLPQGVTAAYFAEPAEFAGAVQDHPDLLVIEIPSDPGALIESLKATSCSAPLLLIVPEEVSVGDLNRWLPFNPQALIPYPFEPHRLREHITATLRSRPEDPIDPAEDALAEANRRLNQRLQEINLLYTIGKSITSSLEVGEVLDQVVASSVNITGADEGFIILQEDAELYLRIAKRRDERFARQIHERISDAVAWQVIRSGHPVMLDRETRIGTGLLVQGLLYVPLNAPGRGPIGVLGVVNHVESDPFNEQQLFVLSSVGDFAAIAFENARLFDGIRSEKVKLSAVLEHASEAVIVTDTANHLWLWSETATEIFSLDPEAQGQPLEEVITHTKLLELFDDGITEAENPRAEIELSSGQVYNAQLSEIAQVGHIIVMQDISHLKELDHLKSEFVSTVSHDLRTPLTTIQGYIALLNRAGPLTDMQETFIHKAMVSLDHITDLITDLLDIGRIEADYDLEMKPLRLDAMIRHTVESNQVEAENQDLELSAHLPDNTLWVHGNRRRLQQIFDNLVSNAMKYNEHGGWIRIEARRNDHHIFVSISDNGIGIPPEAQPKIFERFYRVQSPNTEDIQGTGLGLAIVKSVIEKHKGRIWVESTPGEGSTFSFLLPYHEPDEEEAESTGD